MRHLGEREGRCYMGTRQRAVSAAAGASRSSILMLLGFSKTSYQGQVHEQQTLIFLAIICKIILLRCALC